ncbi:hypothetical protein N7481_008419 [Penicillium waksmanii]|uniref:uncharacterized protein n=1 Tax=Penicillium waksmanii TaxID=69791 RepID=UPI002549B5F9|nr:uncharacterized protein N7481_008419 [Penicillium waksmanii]KAJ5981121.1 hypothetical protein N7481_008419 [Penicillium waksmanii]
MSNSVPNIQHGQFETRYVQMVVQSDEITWEINALASASHWILLAGYLVVPGTFTSLKKSEDFGKTLKGSAAGNAVLNAIQNPPLLTTACFLFVIGLCIMIFLGWKFRENYIWLMNRLLIPTLLNALAGLLTTIINICTANGGDVSIMALLTILASSISVLISIILAVFCFRRLQVIKRDHYAELRLHNMSISSGVNG